CVTLPSSRSRTAPPTSHARRPASAARVSRSGSSTGDKGRQPSIAVVYARDARGETAGDLVVDRVQPPRELLGGDPQLALRPDQYRRPPPQLRSAEIGAEIDGDAVHADGAHQRVCGPVDQRAGGVREPAPPAIAVADRQQSDVRVARCDVAPAIAGALPRA